jgi:hypothetical protein
MCRRSQERNNVMGNRSLETEGGMEGTMKRGFSPYVAKKKIRTTYYDVKEQKFGETRFLTTDLGTSMEK